MIILIQLVTMMTVKFFLEGFKLITLVFFPILILELEDELSLLGFLNLQENRICLFCIEGIYKELFNLKETAFLFTLILEKMCILRFQLLINLLFLHLLVMVKNRVKSLMFELLCLCALNSHYLLRELNSSQKLLSAIFRAREFDLEINSYLYLHKAKQEKKEKAYNNIYKSIGVILLISL